MHRGRAAVCPLPLVPGLEFAGDRQASTSSPIYTCLLASSPLICPVRIGSGPTQATKYSRKDRQALEQLELGYSLLNSFDDKGPRLGSN